MATDYFGARYNPDEPIIVNSVFMVARIKQQLRQLICWSLTSLSWYLHPVMREARSPELTIYYDRRRQTISEDPEYGSFTMSLYGIKKIRKNSSNDSETVIGDP